MWAVQRQMHKENASRPLKCLSDSGLAVLVLTLSYVGGGGRVWKLKDCLVTK